DKKDLNVSLSDGYLTVSAKREEKEENKHNYLRRERSFSCSRSYYVGDDLSEEDVKAKYENGVLTIDIPKKEEKKPKNNNIAIE
ncbi:MAG: Hsp20 family protein, partial [Clostridia bacterium]|nr:Hsp20 family protein [Clostridia bacterium]